MSAPRDNHPIVRGGLLAIAAAVAFGVTTPFVQRFGRTSGAFPTASLLYAGAALASLGRFGARSDREAPVRMIHARRLVLVAMVGSVLAPVSFAWGLQRTSSSGASLLLNFEAVFTVLLAWRIFHEPIGRRVALAVALMVAGGACLVAGGPSARLEWGAAAVVLATLGWAIDNTLSKPFSALDPTQVVRWKAAVGAVFGLLLSWILGQPFPEAKDIALLLVCGATGYGLSLRLYLLAQRRIGAGRTGSVFAIAPFVGAVTSWLVGDRLAGTMSFVAAGLFGLGVLLHLTEAHRHAHTHEAIEHEHAHRHDDGHHDHVHAEPVEGEHSHVHRHEEVTHEHAHAPDIHHGHRHL